VQEFTLEYIRMELDRYMVPTVHRIHGDEGHELMRITVLMSIADDAFVKATLIQHHRERKTRYYLRDGAWSETIPEGWETSWETNPVTLRDAERDQRQLQRYARA
jgi:hypothetical protein